MKVKSMAISSFAKFMLGGEVFNNLISIVTYQDTSTNHSGKTKRENAIEQFKEIGIDIANWALNLGIELAVAYLKSLENRNK
jgi:hypothetical protein